ncbi:MAG: 4-diphosphocytidyl-2-C-methyl-D-erythritol kinase [Verrucomicrobiae bacterium]|nr:4-diphosphocytidyl-2-C-methyl-D-erythritol kinase [Verrucomicrobiae bacterium]
MTTQAELTVFSPAKINLYLRILGKRADGYHDLETVMLPLNFGDEIVCQWRATGLTLECDQPDLPTDDRNLALRAAKRLAERCGVTQGARIILRKRTPLAAGLGGGSSNAAMVLQALNKLWQLDAPRATLDELAAGMGSDINFFLTGTTAVCRGRGEQTAPIPCRLSAAVLLINPGFGISTKWAYDNWAKLTETHPAVTVLARALAADDLNGVSDALFNSLEAPSVGKFPVLQLLKDTLRAHGARGALMSGSGATVFGLFADAGKAETCGVEIRREFGPSMWTQVAKFAESAV